MPNNRETIIWSDGGLLLIRLLETNYDEIQIDAQHISKNKIIIKMPSENGGFFAPASVR